jgi:hypothetical protein
MEGFVKAYVSVIHRSLRFGSRLGLDESLWSTERVATELRGLPCPVNMQMSGRNLAAGLRLVMAAFLAYCDIGSVPTTAFTGMTPQLRACDSVSVVEVHDAYLRE